MKTRQRFSRREFFKTTGGALSLLAVGTYVPSAIANAAGSGSPPVKRDPAQLKRLLDEMDAKGYQFWSVPRKDGEFLHLLVKATRTRNVLELGTSHGFSAIWMGLGLEETGGRLTTIEIDGERYDLARRHMSEYFYSKLLLLAARQLRASVQRTAGLQHDSRDPAFRQFQLRPDAAEPKLRERHQ